VKARALLRRMAIPTLFLLVGCGCAGRRPPASPADVARGARATGGALASNPPETGETPAGRGRFSSVLAEDGHDVVRTFSLAVHTELPPRSAGQRTYLGVLAAASALLETRKEQLRQDVLRSSLARHTGWTDVGGQLGQGRVTQGLALLFYGGGLFADLPRARETGLLLGESYAAAQVTAGALNFVFSERRPRAGGQLRYFRAGGSSTSLHMTNTTVLAMVLDRQLDRIGGASAAGRVAKVLARIGLYAIPTVTAWQRVRSDQHYLWNVALGAGQSAYVTRAVLRAHDRAAGEARPSRAPRLVVAGAPGRGESVALVWDL
jgi:hypothetical protein